MFESFIATIIVGVVEALIFGVIWKKKASPVRDALKAMVGAVKTTGAGVVAKEVKKLTDKNPGVKAAIDKIIAEAHAYVRPAETTGK